jgi:hypothetical protein
MRSAFFVDHRSLDDFRRSSKSAGKHSQAARNLGLERETGLEPATSGLEGMFMNSNTACWRTRLPSALLRLLCAEC